MVSDKDFDSDENIFVYNFENELNNKHDESLRKIIKNGNPLSLNKYYEICLIILLCLSFQNFGLFANEQNSLLTDKDKQILKSDNKEKIIEYLKETFHPYQIDFKQRTSRNRQKLIELNTLASKGNSMNVRIAAFTNLSILGCK